MIIWSQKLDIKLSEQNQSSVIVIMVCYCQLQRNGGIWTDSKVWQALLLHLILKNPQSLYKQETHCVIQNKMSLSERHSSEIPSTLLSHVHLLHQEPLLVVLQIHLLTLLLGTAPTVTPVTFQNQGMEQPINFFMALLLLTCYIFIF